MEIRNLFTDINQRLPDELIEVLVNTGTLAVERIVSQGHTSKAGFWYDQERSELVILLKGSARLEFADPPAQLELKPGDYLTIPAHRKHRVSWTDPEGETIWLTVHFYQTADMGGPAGTSGENHNL